MKVFVIGDTGLLDGLALWPLADPGDVLLYVEVDAVPVAVRDELERLSPDEIVVVGGVLRVGEDVEAELSQYAPVSRIAGATRFTTPIAISQTIYPPDEEPVEPPTGLFIPAFNGNPDVGLITPKDRLVDYDGPLTFAEGDHLLEGLRIDGRITAKGTAHVTIRDCWVIGDIYYAVWNDTRTGPSKILIEDSEIGVDGGASDASGLAGSDVTARRVNIHNREDGIGIGSNCFYEQVHVHSHKSTKAVPHSDGAQSTQHANVTFSYCNLNGLNADGTPANAALQIKTDFAPISNTLVDHCYLGGGNYTVFHRDGGSGAITGSRFTNNVFGLDARYGKVSSDFPFAEWSGNVDVNGVPV